ncbi:MAG: ArsR/SmtB family transcription factor [Chthonomonadales bacterium]
MASVTQEPFIAMERLERVAPVIRAAAHPLRLRILDYLEHAGEPRTVSEIIEATGVAQAVVSQQLRILKDQGILYCRRIKNHVYYGIANPSVLHLLECIRTHDDCGDPFYLHQNTATVMEPGMAPAPKPEHS